MSFGPLTLAELLSLLTLAFFTGIAFQRATQARKDIRNVRGLLNDQVELTRERWLHMVVVLMTMNEGKDVRVVLDLLKRELEKR